MFIYSFLFIFYLCIYSLSYSFSIYSFKFCIHSFKRSFVYSFVHSFIRSFGRPVRRAARRCPPPSRVLSCAITSALSTRPSLASSKRTWPNCSRPAKLMPNPRTRMWQNHASTAGPVSRQICSTSGRNSSAQLHTGYCYPSSWTTQVWHSGTLVAWWRLVGQSVEAGRGRLGNKRGRDRGGEKV